MKLQSIKLNKRIILIIVAAIALLALGVCLLATRSATVNSGEMLKNGDFSAVSAGRPEDWTPGMWVTSAGVSYFEAVTLEDGTRAAFVENAAENDARFEQTVSVRENAVYRLTAKIRAEGCDETKVGANVSFAGVYGQSVSVYDTQGEWVDVEVYAETGKGIRELTVMARLGGYGSETTGKAWFTDLHLTQVSRAPAGATVITLTTPTPQKAETSSDKSGVVPTLLLTAIVYLVLFCGAIVVLLRRPAGVRHLRAGMAVCFALALLLRVILALSVSGYGVDMGCFEAWSARMAEVGPMGFYAEGYFCDYPPAYMLVLGAVGLVCRLLGVGTASAAGQLLLKLVPILCDLALAGVVYFAVRRETGKRAAYVLSLALLLNPAFIVTGACWGQIDCVLALLLALVLLFAQRGRWLAAIPLFALAVLVKPQAGLLVPLGVAALVREWRSKNRRPILIGIGLGLLVTLAVTLPFTPGQSPFWLVNKYVETLSSYNYATLSTGNLMFLLGGNWKAVGQKAILFLNYGQIGAVLMVLSFAAGIVVYLRGENHSRVVLAAAVTLQMLFVLGVKMHERYILPALVLLLLAYAETGDVRLFASFALSSAASMVNIGTVLAFDYLIAPNLWLGYVLSVVQIIALALTLWAAVGLSLRHAPMLLPPVKPRGTDARGETGTRLRDALLSRQDYRLNLRGVDFAVMLSITAVYAVIAFWNLGVTNAPQTGFRSTAAGESVTLDLGEDAGEYHLYYYGAVSHVSFSVTTSQDGQLWTSPKDAFFDQGECFKWLALRNAIYDESGDVTGASGGMLTLSGRYVRLTFDGAGVDLWEVAAVTDAGETLPVKAIASEGGAQGREGDPALLVDEQDAVPDKPSYLNSMYFDEIYHARTGYEHATGGYTYETTHPPLGKVFMSWCIRLMGMTPFAWRFAGALCGVLMLPAIYLLAMQLLHDTRAAGLSCALLALDCMHYTQTRIATIDSFPVLFMMLMFLFMARFTQMDFFREKPVKLLGALLLSGVFMGLAIASKWIGCYGAVGLAVLFFARMAFLLRQSLYARAHRDEDERFAAAADGFARRAVLTLLCCCVFFVLVPVLIYVLSYIPYMRAYGGFKWNAATLQRIWQAQISMFDYHKNLVAEHYFSSPWYEWPLILRPMWFYSGEWCAAGKVSSILTFGNPAVWWNSGEWCAAGKVSSILTFGNPAVWWTGLAAIVFALARGVTRCAMPALDLRETQAYPSDRALPVIAAGFLSAYLPWVFVSRLTFIYHYFASVPFIILAVAYALMLLREKHPRAALAAGAVLLLAALALFIAFFPLTCGLEVSRARCDAVNWFKNLPRGWMWY